MSDWLTIIPARGLPILRQAVGSAVQGDVLIVTDGAANELAVDTLNLPKYPKVPNYVDRLNVPYLCAGKEWSGHRIYAAVPHIVNHKYVAFLDEDNWFEPTHLADCERVLKDFPVAFALRNIVSEDGTFICKDECESLGPTPNAWRCHLVDTSCYAFRGDWIRQHCHAWDHPWGADRRFLELIMSNCPQSIRGTGLHTVNYRTGGFTGIDPSFWIEGNKVMTRAKSQTAEV